MEELDFICLRDGLISFGERGKKIAARRYDSLDLLALYALPFWR
jgi:hypothetical protein